MHSEIIATCWQKFKLNLISKNPLFGNIFYKVHTICLMVVSTIFKLKLFFQNQNIQKWNETPCTVYTVHYTQIFLSFYVLVSLRFSGVYIHDVLNQFQKLSISLKRIARSTLSLLQKGIANSENCFLLLLLLLLLFRMDASTHYPIISKSYIFYQ